MDECTLTTQDKLFKYTTASDGIYYYLCRSELCFTSIVKLNDPFEAAPDFDDELRKQIADLHANVPAALAEVGITAPDNAYQALLEFLEAAGDRAAWEASHFVEFWRFLRAILREIGVLSLSACPRIGPMWSHYSKMSGLALGFSKDCNILTSSNGLNLLGPQKVKYEPTRVPYTRPTMDLRVLCLQKGPYWEYENEYRCFRKIDKGAERAVFKFEPQDLQDIVIGCAMTLDDASRVREFWADKYPHALLQIAYPASDDYTIRLSPAPKDPEQYQSFFTDKSDDFLD